MKEKMTKYSPCALRKLVGALLLCLAGGTVGAAPAALQTLLEAQRYRQAAPLMAPLLAKARPDEAERALIYRWLFAVDDLAEIKRRSDAQRAAAVDLLAAGRLALDRQDFEPAGRLYAQALRRARTAELRAQALRGQGLLAYQQNDYEASLRLLEAARRQAASPDVLVSLADTLIRLGRTNDAVEAAEQALRLSPYHEAANYLRGNGYSRHNYSELASRCGSAFERASAATHQASEAFEQAQLDAARRDADAALAACPGYGRAHAVLAKVAEAERQAVDVHRAADEARFAATPMPEVPQIERYVANWEALTPRHRKRVALSVAPWKAYVPILVAGGASHFIKPLHLRLSETPGAAALRDARIEHDSRLWDDVRGMGGHLAVTGIEDVERSIFGRYNTLLHELSHQVHGVMTAELKREIQELYRQAKERDAKTGRAFLSRYAGSSIWEYFAEGANSQESPRRNAFDPREIVRERLIARDPALQALVLRLFAQTDVGASLPVALVNGSHRHFETGDLKPGLEQLEQALRLAPQDPQVLSANLYGLSLQGQAEPLAQLAERALALHPDDGALRVAAIGALWRAGRPLAPLMERLAAGRDALRADDRFAVDMALGGYALHLGQAEAALTAYGRALAYQADSPEALWGQAAALAQAQRWDQAFAVYDRVLKLRTGQLSLRLALARDLLLAGRAAQARRQLDEARTLKADDPELLALLAWQDLAGGQPAAALAQAETALARGPWSDTAPVIRVAALRALGRQPEADGQLAELRARLATESVPRYVYRADTSSWEPVQRSSAALRRVLAALLAEPRS